MKTIVRSIDRTKEYISSQFFSKLNQNDLDTVMEEPEEEKLVRENAAKMMVACKKAPGLIGGNRTTKCKLHWIDEHTRDHSCSESTNFRYLNTKGFQNKK